MEINFIAVFVSAIIPLIIGSLWYSPVFFAKAWMKETGLSEEDLKKGSMLKIFGLTYVFSVMLALLLQMLCIHQFGPLGMIGGPQFVENALPSYTAFMNDYGMAFRTFKHGALHGFMSGLFIAFPLIAINGLFERRTWKYILIHTGYWTLVMTLMGALLCGWV